MSNYYYLESFDSSKNNPEKPENPPENPPKKPPKNPPKNPQENPQENPPENKVYKDKFFVRGDPSKDVPGHYRMSQGKCQMIDTETNLLTPGIQTNDKTQVVLKEDLDPYNYNIDYKDGLKRNQNQNQKTDFYYNNKNVGPGRGFGNLNISNDIRNGDASRNDTQVNNEKQEGLQMFDYKFQYLNKDFQDPNHIVMSIPRGGVQTRKQKQLSVDTMRTVDSKDQYEHIKYNY